MKLIISVIFLIILGNISSFGLITTALAQVYPEEFDDCEIREYKERAYTPFRIAMRHEPALNQKIEDSHRDPQSRLIFEQVEREDDAKSFLAFYTNSTDDWTIRVDLEYKTEHGEPREILIDIDAGNRDYNDERIFHEGFNFCIVYFIFTRPEPHSPTAEEVLSIADMQARQHVQVMADEVNELVEKVERSQDTSTIIGLLYSVLLISVIVGGVTLRKSYGKLKKATELERGKLQLQRQKDDTRIKFLKTEILEMKTNFCKFLDEMGVMFRLGSFKIPTTKDITKPEPEHETEQEPESKSGVVSKVIELGKSTKDSILQKIKSKDPEVKSEINLIEKFQKLSYDELYKKYNEYYEKYNLDPNEENKLVLNIIFDLMEKKELW